MFTYNTDLFTFIRLNETSFIYPKTWAPERIPPTPVIRKELHESTHTQKRPGNNPTKMS